MRLIYKLASRLALILLPIVTLWAVIFYYTMVEEINDESDDSLVEYAELIIRKQLAGVPLPPPNNGSNNSYSIELIENRSDVEPSMTFHDEMVYIPEQDDTEPARVLTTIFMDDSDNMYKLTVAMPTFERDDLLSAIFWHIIVLYAVLVISSLLVATLIFYNSMRPLYALLAWLDRYVPGRKIEPVPDSSVVEFHKLSMATRLAMSRAEEHFGRQKQFIDNASHELQTPLAVIGNRLEWLVDNTSLTEEQYMEISKIQHTLGSIVRLNRTLLLLTKIDNGQFPESAPVDMVALLKSEAEIYSDIYSDRNVALHMQLPHSCVVGMNDSLAKILVTNLLKNAYQHSSSGAAVRVTLMNRELRVYNNGQKALDGSRIFERFYHSGNSNSTGLGLALVHSICRYYGFVVTYSFLDGEHCFCVRFQ